MRGISAFLVSVCLDVALSGCFYDTGLCYASGVHIGVKSTELGCGSIALTRLVVCSCLRFSFLAPDLCDSLRKRQGPWVRSSSNPAYLYWVCVVFALSLVRHSAGITAPSQGRGCRAHLPVHQEKERTTQNAARARLFVSRWTSVPATQAKAHYSPCSPLF